MMAQGSKSSELPLVRDAMQILWDSVLARECLHGGDLSEIIRLQLQSGKDVVVKIGPHPDRKGRMLRRLADAGAHVPLPIASNAKVLVLEDLGAGASPSRQSWRALGMNLRAVHAAQGDRCGWGEDHAFGTVQIHKGVE